jgi:hypothetical protein
MGWFHSTPKSEKPSKDKQLNRAEKIKAAGGTPLMPQCDAEYLIAYWNDLGLCSSGGMGAVGLSSLEIDSWSRLSAVELEPWEFQALRQMSQHYVSMVHKGEDVDCPPPFGEMASIFDRDVVGKKVTNAFKSFIMAGKK